jgi:hypothetical protein
VKVNVKEAFKINKDNNNDGKNRKLGGEEE